MPVTIGELEAIAARAWRAPEEEPLDEWLQEKRGELQFMGYVITLAVPGQ